MAKSRGFRTGQGPQRTAHIAFAVGHALHGFEAEVGLRVPVGVILAADRDVLGVGAKAFVEKIISWNLLNENDEPVPISEDEFRTQFDIIEAGELVKAWIEAVAQPSAPLSQASNGTGSSSGGSTPTAIASRSRRR
jgi:hypothetical protein